MSREKLVLSERKNLDTLFETLEDWNSVLESSGYSPSDLKYPRPGGPRP